MTVEIEKGFWTLVIEFVGGSPLPMIATRADVLTYLVSRDGQYEKAVPEFIETLLTEDARRNLPFAVTTAPQECLRFSA